MCVWKCSCSILHPIERLLKQYDQLPQRDHDLHDHQQHQRSAIATRGHAEGHDLHERYSTFPGVRIVFKRKHSSFTQKMIRNHESRASIYLPLIPRLDTGDWARGTSLLEGPVEGRVEEFTVLIRCCEPKSSCC